MQNMTGGRREGTWETVGHLGSAQLGETLDGADPLGVLASHGDRLPALLLAPRLRAETCFQIWE